MVAELGFVAQILKYEISGLNAIFVLTVPQKQVFTEIDQNC
jgi:hypothetical protein